MNAGREKQLNDMCCFYGTPNDSKRQFCLYMLITHPTCPHVTPMHGPDGLITLFSHVSSSALKLAASLPTLENYSLISFGRKCS
ncbi:hypothetical protein CARUB_v10006243mg [Capsella rubella]|uniref:Uncharacterized protein n=1 Tax=Capsella rubella TaxID=81985 RepID=R0GLS8_9BRAS|nr:hypothetical protein CARUB_v10006243mg [Capsella rubella]